MKTWLTISMIGLAWTHAQTIDRFVIGSTGASVQTHGFSIDMTLGETIGNYFSSGDFIITPGFQQGNTGKRSTSIFLTGRIAGNKTILQWSMPFEKNSSMFYIQKQNDTLNSFHDIGSANTQAPGGNTTTPTSYFFTDAYPVEGISGYRIKLVLQDGSIYYSNTIQLIYKGVEWWLAGLYPNPARSFTHVKIFSAQSILAHYAICDAEGKVFYTGTQDIPAGNTEIYLNLAAVPSGNYFFKIWDDGKKVPDLVARFIKLL